MFVIPTRRCEESGFATDGSRMDPKADRYGKSVQNDGFGRLFLMRTQTRVQMTVGFLTIRLFGMTR